MKRRPGSLEFKVFILMTPTYGSQEYRGHRTIDADNSHPVSRHSQIFHIFYIDLYQYICLLLATGEKKKHIINCTVQQFKIQSIVLTII